MSTTKQQFSKLQPIPLIFLLYQPKPLFYPHNSNDIIISTDSRHNNPGIFKYNIITNKLEIIHKYNDYDTYQISRHGQFIDYRNEILYIFGGNYDTFRAFNLKTNTMSNMGSNNSGQYVKSVHIPSTNEIHILDDSEHHSIFDCNDKLFREINCNHDALLNYNSDYNSIAKLIYCEFNKQLMILGADDIDKIFYCNIKKQSENVKMEWKLNKQIKMPHIVFNEMDYDIIVFNDVIVVFYFSDEGYYDIWCLDLLSQKWFKSKYNMPKSVESYSYVLEHNNIIHILDFYHQNHFTINIYNIFSNEIIKLRRKHYNKLVIGFIKQQENNNVIPATPFVLKQLISYYFQLFG